MVFISGSTMLLKIKVPWYHIKQHMLVAWRHDLN